MLELYLGGARSGKSRLAERHAQWQAVCHNRRPIYVATALAGDREMAQRIAEHQRRRLTSTNKVSWRTVEQPKALADTLLELDDERHCIVVDCLTLWISNLLLEPTEQRWLHEREKLLQCLPGLNSHIIFVSNEVGQGIVPANEISRRFVDDSGFLHQALARVCDRVVFMVAGLAQVLKGQALPDLPDDEPTSGETM